MRKIKQVLFLCSGNTSRSPAAEYLAKWLKTTKYKEELREVTFDSAGLYSYYKTPREGTANYLKSKGINFNDFIGKQIDEDLVKSQDLILGFENKWHVKKLKRRFKNLTELDKKAQMLLEFAEVGDNTEIPDPINFEPGEYREVMERIEEGVDKSLKKIIEINSTEDK
ncbi:MAG: arsenate reductase/protein-tyrosine-phosphatase family protein [Promethearchaeota archaeon]